MKIVALCKTFAGEEWIEAMTKSIYPFIEKIVFVNSELSWNGRKGNTCKSEIKKMQASNIGDKIISLDFDTINQAEQCNAGFDYVKENYSCDIIMFVDTDEVWDNANLQHAIRFIENKNGQEAFKVSMYTYIKSPYWRVTPVEPLKPVCFVRSKVENLGRLSRGVELRAKLIPNCYFHHFVYVRKNFNTILEKIITSNVSENTKYEDMSVWIPKIWNSLPSGVNIHPSIGHQHFWKSLVKVDKNQLPEILQSESFEITERYNESCTNKNLCS